MDYGRIHWYEPDELNADQLLVYEEGPEGRRHVDSLGRPYGPRNGYLINPLVGELSQALGNGVRTKTEMSVRAREIAILEVAAHRECEYEWWVHYRRGLADGTLTQAEFDAIHNAEECESFSANESLLRRVTQLLLRDRRLSDETYEELVKQLGLRFVADLLAVVGYYDMLALMLDVFKLSPPSGASKAF